jgi:hypothetical protein
MVKSMDVSAEKPDINTSADYIAYVILKAIVFALCCTGAYFLLFHGQTPYYKNMFEEISRDNIFPFNLYPDIAAVEICIEIALLSVLFFHNDRFKGIAFSAKFDAMVIGISFSSLFIPMMLLEAFYINSGDFAGLGYAGVHLLLNIAVIAGLIFSPIFYISSIASCFMVREIYKDTVEKSENDTGTCTATIGTIISIEEFRRKYVNRTGLMKSRIHSQ